MDMSKFILIFLGLFFVSCSARHSPFFLGYDEWIQRDISNTETSSAARFDWSTLPDVITSIDGVVVGSGYKKARLSPGKHQFEYADHPASFGVHPKGMLEVNLLAGHLYEFRIEYCFWCKPRKYTVWVDDKTTGELVWGKRPDWPSWWL